MDREQIRWMQVKEGLFARYKGVSMTVRQEPNAPERFEVVLESSGRIDERKTLLVHRNADVAKQVAIAHADYMVNIRSEHFGETERRTAFDVDLDIKIPWDNWQSLTTKFYRDGRLDSFEAEIRFLGGDARQIVIISGGKAIVEREVSNGYGILMDILAVERLIGELKVQNDTRVKLPLPGNWFRDEKSDDIVLVTGDGFEAIVSAFGDKHTLRIYGPIALTNMKTGPAKVLVYGCVTSSPRQDADSKILEFRKILFDQKEAQKKAEREAAAPEKSKAPEPVQEKATQPAPAKNEEQPVWPKVVADMQARDALGEARYGTRLQPFNGRHQLLDAYEESLDKTVYLKSAILEDQKRRKAVDQVFQRIAFRDGMTDVIEMLAGILEQWPEMKGEK